VVQRRTLRRLELTSKRRQHPGLREATEQHGDDGDGKHAKADVGSRVIVRMRVEEPASRADDERRDFA
jgi:hypothetical protein